MQFSAVTITALFAALVSAGPIAERQARGTEAVAITSLSVRNIDNAINSVSFNVRGDTGDAVDVVECTASITSADFANTLSCATAGWSFYIKELDLTNYNLILYKQTGDITGIWGQVNTTLVAHVGGSSATDYVLNQSGDIKFNLVPAYV